MAWESKYIVQRRSQKPPKWWLRACRQNPPPAFAIKVEGQIVPVPCKGVFFLYKKTGEACMFSEDPMAWTDEQPANLPSHWDTVGGSSR